MELARLEESATRQKYYITQRTYACHQPTIHFFQIHQQRGLSLQEIKMAKACIRLLLLLLLLVLLCSACSAFHGIRRNTWSSVARQQTTLDTRQMPHQRRQVLVVPKRRDTVLSIRGGGGEQSDSLVFTKIQNVIRSLLQVLERRLPILATLLKAFLGIIERILRIDLIPKKPILKTKKRKRTTRGVHSKKDDQETKTKKNTKSLSNNNKHVTQKLSSKSPNYRIQKELREFIQHPPPNLKVKVGSNIRVWIVELTGAEGSIYEGETYRLRISFPPAYPTVPPSVYFLPPTPQHEHVYTNGDICLSLLGKGWQPQMTAQSIAVSILSILSSASTKSIPMDNARHAQNKPGQYQKDWVYHDDKC